MIVRQALANGRWMLEEYEIEDAPLEAEILLRDVLKKTRAELHLELDRELSPHQYAAFRQLIRRRCRDEPTAYILGRREFYGRDFLVNLLELTQIQRYLIVTERPREVQFLVSSFSLLGRGTRGTPPETPLVPFRKKSSWCPPF